MLHQQQSGEGEGMEDEFSAVVKSVMESCTKDAIAVRFISLNLSLSFSISLSFSFSHSAPSFFFSHQFHLPFQRMWP